LIIKEGLIAEERVGIVFVGGTRKKPPRDKAEENAQIR
jgi:hypothetical protein